MEFIGFHLMCFLAVFLRLFLSVVFLGHSDFRANILIYHRANNQICIPNRHDYAASTQQKEPTDVSFN